MVKTRNGLQKSVCDVFDAYHGWNGVDLDQRTSSASVTILEQTIDRLVEARPLTKTRDKTSSGVIGL
jgi:hypothetical protein